MKEDTQDWASDQLAEVDHSLYGQPGRTLPGTTITAALFTTSVVPLQALMADDELGTSAEFGGERNTHDDSEALLLYFSTIQKLLYY